MERRAERLTEPAREPFIRDARLIRTELDRCRRILEQMSAEAGEALGEGASRAELAALFAGFRAALPPERSRRLIVMVPAGLFVHIPARALQRVLGSLVSNAFD